MEDIIYIIDNRTTIVAEIKNSVPPIRAFLQSQFLKLKNNHNYHEILSAHIHPLILADRQPLVEEKINQVLAQ